VRQNILVHSDICCSTLAAFLINDLPWDILYVVSSDTHELSDRLDVAYDYKMFRRIQLHSWAGCLIIVHPDMSSLNEIILPLLRSVHVAHMHALLASLQ